MEDTEKANMEDAKEFVEYQLAILQAEERSMKTFWRRIYCINDKTGLILHSTYIYFNRWERFKLSIRMLIDCLTP